LAPATTDEIDLHPRWVLNPLFLAETHARWHRLNPMTVGCTARRRTIAWTLPLPGAHEPALPDLGDLYRHTTILSR